MNAQTGAHPCPRSRSPRTSMLQSCPTGAAPLYTSGSIGASMPYAGVPTLPLWHTPAQAPSVSPALFWHGRSAASLSRGLEEKLPQIDLKSLAKVPESYDCGIALSQLQAAHVGAINTHSVSKLGLTQAGSLAQPSHIGAENPPHVFGHGRTAAECIF